MYTIPVIDFEDYISDNIERKQNFIVSLSNALHTLGFVSVINTGISKDILDRAYDSSKDFFNEQLEYKMLCNNSKMSGQRGFVQSEIAKGSVIKDFKEFYHICINEISNKNIWPKDINSEFKHNTQELVENLNKHAIVLQEALSESIGEHKDFFNNMTYNGESLLRSIHYPINPNNSVYAAEHTDIDLFTILPRATLGGLQILYNDNWLDVIVPDGSFIINAGDLLQNITNGFYKSSVHRVICKDSRLARYSIVYFIHPESCTRLDPLPKFGPEVYPRATQKELLNIRLTELGLITKI